MYRCPKKYILHFSIESKCNTINAFSDLKFKRYVVYDIILYNLNELQKQ